MFSLSSLLLSLRKTETERAKKAAQSSIGSNLPKVRVHDSLVRDGIKTCCYRPPSKCEKTLLPERSCVALLKCSLSSHREFSLPQVHKGRRRTRQEKTSIHMEWRKVSCFSGSSPSSHFLAFVVAYIGIGWGISHNHSLLVRRGHPKRSQRSVTKNSSSLWICVGPGRSGVKGTPSSGDTRDDNWSIRGCGSYDARFEHHFL